MWWGLLRFTLLATCNTQYSIIDFCLFYFTRFPWQVYLGSLPLPPPVNHILSELSTVTRLSWVALHGVAQLTSPFPTTRQWSMALKRLTVWIITNCGKLLKRWEYQTISPAYWLIGKVPDAWKNCRQKEKRASEDELSRWHHPCNGHELGQTLGDGEGQGGLACCGPRGRKELNMTGIIDFSYFNFNELVFK